MLDALRERPSKKYFSVHRDLERRTGQATHKATDYTKKIAGLAEESARALVLYNKATVSIKKNRWPTGHLQPPKYKPTGIV